MAGAYSALLSLRQTLNHTLTHDPHPHLFQKDQLLSLQENVTTLLTFLEQHSHLSSEAVQILESRITDAAYRAEDVVESPSDDASSLEEALQEIDFILKDAAKIEVNDAAESTPSLVLSDPAISSNNTDSSINTNIFEDDFAAISDRIYGHSPDLEVIPIFGMGGIGKSTLARRLYQDSAKSNRFDRRVWMVVSQDYSLRNILLGILQSMQIQSLQECTDIGKLKELVHKELFNRRYLFVVDDIWSTEAWDDINLILPKERKGSRVIVTIRSSDVAGHVGSSPHEINLLKEDQSWSLLEESVFGKVPCPSELKQNRKGSLCLC